jgi:hypothetical protein
MLFVKAAIVAALAFVGVASTAGERAGAQREEPIDFLHRLAGEWSVVAEATLGPGQEPVRTESREVARLLGGKWLVAESTRSVRGQLFTSILTLGYDPFNERFVGTWIDSMQTHLWSYTGMLDDSRTVLMLETEGPILGDPTRTAQYREVIEIVAADHKVMRSMILGPDGKWFEFARAEYRRSE